MGGYTQSDRILEVTKLLGANKLLAERFSGMEQISELFEYAVEVLAEPETTVNPAALVGKRVTVTLRVTDGGDKRYFNGIVASLEGSGGDSFFNTYRIRMVPALWLLSLNTQTRVFQDKTVLEIAKAVLAPYSITPTDDTHASYPALEYCTQYRETDLHFVQRLLEQHGIFFYFRHSESDHVLVLADSVSALSECPVVDEFKFGTTDKEPMTFYEARVHRFASRSTLVTGKETSWDYRFPEYKVSPDGLKTTSTRGPMGDNSHEHYDFSDSAAAFMKTPEGDAKIVKLQELLQGVAKEGNEAQSVLCDGASTANTMQAGCTFQLKEYPQTEKNGKYVLTAVKHEIQQRPSYRSVAVPPRGAPYSNLFEARPFEQAYRKERTRTRPRVNGVVTGKVVTPGDDSYLDKYGRVCVQFWWDRKRPPNTPDKTLLRVAQPWGGKGWGTFFWPRIGDEVLIDFIEGDPDAPIVVGSVYNGVNLPKYNPKAEYTRSGVRTRSSPNGSDSTFNELRMEDKKGAEQVFLHGERDMDVRVKNDARRWIGQQDSLFVGGMQAEEIQGNRETTVKGDQKTTVGGSLDTTVAQRIVVQAGTQISLRVAESFVTIGPEGVVISGPMIRLNSGGTPGVSLGEPKLPDLADDGTRGGKM